MQQIVFEKVKNIINPYLEYSCEISMESCFYNELSINSVDLLNIITQGRIERETIIENAIIAEKERLAEEARKAEEAARRAEQARRTAAGGGGTAQGSQPSGNLARQVFDLTNAERRNAGLPDLIWHDTLANAANTRAVELMTLYSHYRPDGRYPWTAYEDLGGTYWTFGENIAMGQRSAEQVVSAWMNSTRGHREAILNSSYTHLGVGVSVNSNGRIHWVQLFAG